MGFILCSSGLADKMLRAMSLLFLSNLFQSSFPAGNLISSQLYLLINGLSFVILSGLYLTSSWCNAAIIAYLKYSLSLRFLGLIVAYLSDIHLGEGIYELPLFKSMSWNCIVNRSTQSNE